MITKEWFNQLRDWGEGCSPPTSPVSSRDVIAPPLLKLLDTIHGVEDILVRAKELAEFCPYEMGAEEPARALVRSLDLLRSSLQREPNQQMAVSYYVTRAAVLCLDAEVTVTCCDYHDATWNDELFDLHQDAEDKKAENAGEALNAAVMALITRADNILSVDRARMKVVSAILEHVIFDMKNED